MGPQICLDEDGIPYIPVGIYKLQVDMEELEGEYLERAQKDLRETPETKTEAIAALRKLLENEVDLIMPAEKNDFLLKFLRPCKFYPESAYKLMRKYYKFKTKYPKYSDNLVPSALRPVVSQNIATFLPTRDRSGCRIMILAIGSKWDPKIVKLHDLFRAIMMFIEIGMAEPKTQMAGVQVILDMKELALAQVYQFGPSFAKAVLEWVQECTPLRLKGIHVVNEPKIFNILYQIFKPFINEKLRKRIFFHGDSFNKLLEVVGVDFLPAAYGGEMEMPEVPGDIMADLLCLYENEFQEANAIGYAKEKVIMNG